jgi:hypothetical protein
MIRNRAVEECRDRWTTANASVGGGDDEAGARGDGRATPRTDGRDREIRALGLSPQVLNRL